MPPRQKKNVALNASTTHKDSLSLTLKASLSTEKPTSQSPPKNQSTSLPFSSTRRTKLPFKKPQLPLVSAIRVESADSEEILEGFDSELGADLEGLGVEGSKEPVLEDILEGFDSELEADLEGLGVKGSKEHVLEEEEYTLKEQEIRPDLREEENQADLGEAEDSENEGQLDKDVKLSEDDFDDWRGDDLFFNHLDENINIVDVERGVEVEVEEIDEVEEEGVQDPIVEPVSVVELEEEHDLVSDEEELNSQHGSDDESVKVDVFNPETDFQKGIQLRVGLSFSSNKVLRKVIRFLAIEKGFDYYFLHNDRKRICIYCRHRCKCGWVIGEGKLKATKNCKYKQKDKCYFSLNATKIEGEQTFRITSYRPERKCISPDINSKITTKYLSERYLEDFRLENNWDLEVFQKKVTKDTRVVIGYYKAYYAKKTALMMIHGLESAEYKRVWDYAQTVVKHNRGSSIFVKLGNIEKQPPFFERMYMCLEGCKVGFIARCRPILGIDGGHLKGSYPEQLLTAVGKDGNCNIFSIAWVVVEVENTETWTWFLDLLVKDLQPISNNITFISDRQKGLLEAFKMVVPNNEARYCAMHIWTNFKAIHPGLTFKEFFWKAARAYTKTDYEQAMESIKMMSMDAYNYLTSIPTFSWSRHAFTINCRSGMLLNNCCESFNKVLKKCRDKPILSLMEWIRRYTIQRIVNKREGADKHESHLMPSAIKQLSMASNLSRNCELIQSGLMTFEVDYFGDRYLVNLDEKTCSCYKWDLTGIPCAHVVACIMNKRLDLQSFVHPAFAFTKETYLKAYGTMLSPIPGPKQWESTLHVQPDPPPFRKMPGKPSNKKRKKQAGENEERRAVKRRRSTKKKCGNCGQIGHKKKGCNNPTVLQLSKRRAQMSASNVIQEEVHLTQTQPSQSVLSSASVGDPSQSKASADANTSLCIYCCCC